MDEWMDGWMAFYLLVCSKIHTNVRATVFVSPGKAVLKNRLTQAAPTRCVKKSFVIWIVFVVDATGIAIASP
jgi:hypothetical protein